MFSFARFSLLATLAMCVVTDATSATNSATVPELPPVAPGIIMPVTITTNKDGTPVHHFSMSATVTNMVSASNDLARLQATLSSLDSKLTQLETQGVEVRKQLRTGYREMFGATTNFVAQNKDGKKLQARIAELELELKTLKAEFQKKLEVDAGYKAVATRIQANTKEFEGVEVDVKKVREKHEEMFGEVVQLQRIMDQTRRAEEQKAKDAAAASHHTGTPKPQ